MSGIISHKDINQSNQSTINQSNFCNQTIKQKSNKQCCGSNKLTDSETPKQIKNRLKNAFLQISKLTE